MSALCEDENFDFKICAVQKIESKVICSLGDILSKISDAKSKLQDIQTLTDRNEFCVPNDIRKVIKMKKAIMDKTTKNISDCLEKVRKGESDIFEFELIEQTYHDSSSILDQFFQKMQPIVARIEFINYAKNQDALTSDTCQV